MLQNVLLLSVLLLVSKKDSVGQIILPIQTDRPDQTETPFTVPKNYFQMEIGCLLEQNKDDTKSITVPTILTKFGLSDQFEVGIITEVATETINTETVTGLSPITFRIKETIAQEKGFRPTTSFIGYFTVPDFASEKFKTTYYAPAFKFAMQHTLTDKISLSYNLGAAWDGETAEPTFNYTLSTGYSISEELGAYIEIYGFIPQKSISEHLFDCGLTYLLSSNILLDVSGGVGLTSKALKYFAGLGCSFRIKN